MNQPQTDITEAVVASQGAPDFRRSDLRPLGLLLSLIALQVAVYFGTYRSMWDIWERSETFSHGFLIFPISAWLIWRNRAELMQQPLVPDPRALVPLLMLVLGWSVARAVDVLVVEQYMAVLMLPVLVWLCLGLRAVWALAFPLAFTLFAVPMGEFLIYPMMRFTASFTVHAIRMTGIPVFWDGMYFTLPSGSWNIVEGCSGVRYIIASVTLGTLFAYLSYYSYWRRTAFILASCIVPVIANGMRAFIIVMLGHFSNMKIATGVDHLIYGWVWFGIVMFFLFLVGGYFRDEAPAAADSVATQPVSTSRSGWAAWLAALPPALLLLVAGPLWVNWVEGHSDAPDFRIPVLAPAGAWTAVEPPTEWRPEYHGASDERHFAFADDERVVGVHLAFFGTQSQGAELINSQNVMVVQKHPVWREPSQTERTVRVKGRVIPLIESRIESDQQKLLVWHWMRIGDEDFSNPYVGKIREVLHLLLTGDRTGFGVVVYAPHADGPDLARERMQAFLEAMLPSIDAVTRVD